MPHSEATTEVVQHEKCSDIEYQRKNAEYQRQAERLAHLQPGETQAVEAKFITAHDPVILTKQGKRLPVVPIDEALKLNRLKDELEGREPQVAPSSNIREAKDGTLHGSRPPDKEGVETSAKSDAPLRESVPQSRTNPLFPPLPMYGPPTLMRTVQCRFFRATSAVLSFCFLLAIIAGATVKSVPKIWRRTRYYMRLQSPTRARPFHQEEQKRAKARKTVERAWLKEKKHMGIRTPSGESTLQADEYVPTEGGPDPLVPDIAYYARRVGLDSETFEVQTEDGFIIELHHIYDPREYRPATPKHHTSTTPELFRKSSTASSASLTEKAPPSPQHQAKGKKYPILLIPGLLQHAGAYCCNDDSSLAFYLCKSGFDVWLGNNRCGFNPKHTLLHYSDPRMWAWNIRQMGVLDLPALISRVLSETGFEKLGLIAHSQGTTQTLVALAKEQRPDIGNKVSVFCALAPAAYSGPLIGKAYFTFMRLIPPALFRLIFGIHAFIPLMPMAHLILPASFYSFMGYFVFSFLFSWSDSRWDKGLRDRMFQFAPVYVSSESMRWWLGRECFAKQKCILATREEGQLEDKEDEEDDEVIRRYYVDREPHVTERRKLQRNLSSFHCQELTHQHHDTTRGKYAWYDSQFPPLALWVCGADDLVDGRRLLRRLDRGREPNVRVVHKKIIEGYEHLDVIWAVDMVEKVGKEVREVLWRTVGEQDKARCRVPSGCETEIEVHPEDALGQMRARQRSMERLASFQRTGAGAGAGAGAGVGRKVGRGRMPSISESPARRPPASLDHVAEDGQGEVAPKTLIDTTKGEWTRDLEMDKAREDAPVIMNGAREDGEGKTSDESEREGKGESLDEREFEEAVGGAEQAWESGSRKRAESEVQFTDLEERGNPLG